MITSSHQSKHVWHVYSPLDQRGTARHMLVGPNLTFIFIAALDVRRLTCFNNFEARALPEKGIYR